MPRCFIGNFDFEHTLARGNAASLPLAMQAINAELAAAWIAIAATGDVIILPKSPDAEFKQTLSAAGFPEFSFISNLHKLKNRPTNQAWELIPWGATDVVKTAAEQSGLTCIQPKYHAVQQANSRLFASALEQELQVGLAGMATVQSLDDMKQALNHLPDSTSAWVVKHEFSNSARERILGRNSKLSLVEINWLQKRWQQNVPLFFEPWVEKIEEVGIHFTIPQSGEAQFNGLTALLTDRFGRYCGSRLVECSSADNWQSAIDVGLRVASRLQQIGYFGPLSIDAMRYRNSAGEIAVRPLQDINARYTMGRLALGFRKLYQPGENAAWYHLPASHRAVNPSPAIRVIPTSPQTWNGQPVQHRTQLCIAHNLETLLEYEATLWNG